MQPCAAAARDRDQRQRLVHLHLGAGMPDAAQAAVEEIAVLRQVSVVEEIQGLTKFWRK
jgi:hypothetical protein